jgi:hypothetical protein
VKYKEEKPPKTKIPFISKLMQKIGLKQQSLELPDRRIPGL